MNCIILAAGFSTRLYPLTENFPKALLEVKGKPIISNLLEELVNCHDIQNTAMVTNARYEQHFREFLQQNSQFSHIQLFNNGVSDKDLRLGAIGDLLFALEQTGWQDDLLVLPSDTIVSLNLQQFLEFAQGKNAFSTVVFDYKNPEIIRGKLGCAVLDEDKIIDFAEKPETPPSTLACVPIYFYPKETLRLLSEYQDADGNLDSPGAIIPWLLEKTTCYAYQITDGYYHDVGTKEVLEKLNR